MNINNKKRRIEADIDLSFMRQILYFIMNRQTQKQFKNFKQDQRKQREETNQRKVKLAQEQKKNLKLQERSHIHSVHAEKELEIGLKRKMEEDYKAK